MLGFDFYQHPKFKQTFSIFSCAFGIFCFGFVISSIMYVSASVKFYDFDISIIINQLSYFLIINIVVSLFLSILLVIVFNISVGYSVLFSFFIYFITAQFYFHSLRGYNISAFWGLFLYLFLILLYFIYRPSSFSFALKCVANTSSALTIVLFIFFLVKPKPPKADMPSMYNKLINSNSGYLKNIYENFRSSSKKKYSLIIVFCDELPYTFISNGNKIKDIFPNIKNLSENSLFFTKAFSNYDGTRRSVPSVFTGKYLTQKYFTNHRKTNDWLFEQRNIFIDLKMSGYNVLNHNDPFDTMNMLSTDNNYSGANIFGEDVFVKGTLNYLKSLYSFGTVTFFDYYYFASNYKNIVDLVSLRNKLVLSFIFFPGSHAPYTFQQNGKENNETPNSYYKPNVDNLYAIESTPLEQIPIVQKKHIEELRFFDMVLGGLFQKILKDSKKEDTIIVFSSDHGVGWRPPHLGREGGHINWDNIGVPLMIYCPSKLKPQVYDKPFPLIDLLPTLYDLMEIEYKEEEFDGISLFNKNREKRKDIFAYSGGCQYVLRNDEWEEVKSAFYFYPAGKSSPVGGIDCKCLKSMD
jgi:hypothetical protein